MPEHAPAEDLYEFHEQFLCEDCLSSETAFCEQCGGRIWADDNAGDEHIHLCQSCYDRCYTRCSHCGRVVSDADVFYPEDDSDQVLCDMCSRHYQSAQVIHDYYYKPEFTFYGDGNRYFRVELEIDGAGESNPSARKILEIANAEGQRLYCKHDGSLDDGFELVTHPMTLAYHLKEMPWEKILNKAKSMGYTSHQARTCGLHVHVNRTAFVKTEAEQDEYVACIMYFFEKNREELLENAKKWYRGKRYTCVNLCNTHTIEFRIFRGTLKLNTLIATLQLID